MLRTKANPTAGFLAEEIRETARLTRFLAQAASHAIETFSGQSGAGAKGENATKLALDNLMMALQSQDRIEQRLSRLADYARRLEEPDGFAGLASETAKKSLVLDELVNAFEQRARGTDALRTSKAPSVVHDSDIELF